MLNKTPSIVYGLPSTDVDNQLILADTGWDVKPLSKDPAFNLMNWEREPAAGQDTFIDYVVNNGWLADAVAANNGRDIQIGDGTRSLAVHRPIADAVEYTPAAVETYLVGEFTLVASKDITFTIPFKKTDDAGADAQVDVLVYEIDTSTGRPTLLSGNVNWVAATSNSAEFTQVSGRVSLTPTDAPDAVVGNVYAIGIDIKANTTVLMTEYGRASLLYSGSGATVLPTGDPSPSNVTPVFVTLQAPLPAV